MGADPQSRQDKALEDAHKLFESHPDFARMQVRMRDRMKEAAQTLDNDARSFGSKARMEYVLNLFDIRAESFLELVSDIPGQNAFMVLLHTMVDTAWQEYTGYPLEVLRPASAEADADVFTLLGKVQLWTHKGYVRLVSRSNARHESNIDDAAAIENNAQSLRAPIHTGRSGLSGLEPRFPKRALWLNQRLSERGWSHADPSKFCGPDRKSIEKILKGEGVRNDVLLKLAEALSKTHATVDVLKIPSD